MTAAPPQAASAAGGVTTAGGAAGGVTTADGVMTADGAVGGGTGTRQRLTLVAVALAAFVTALDNTVVNVALPAIGADLHLDRAGLEWVGAAYLLTFAGLLLPGGRVTDLWGRRTCLAAGMAVFTLSSALAAWSPTGWVLVASRAVQGIGAAVLLPAALAVLAADLDPAVRRVAAGVWTAAIAVALSVGPVAGGALTQLAGWRWVFTVNVPIGVLTIAVALATLPPGRTVAAGTTTPGDGVRGWRALDLPGLLTSAVGLLAATGALVEWNVEGGGSAAVRVAVVVSALSWAAFVDVERRSAHPLIPVSLWRRRAFTGGSAAQVLWGLGINGILFFTSMYLQGVLGLGPTAAGLVFVPIAVAVAVAVLPAGKLTDRFGAAGTVAAGMVVVSVGLVAVALADPGHGVAGVLPGLVLVGLGSGLTTPLTDGVLAVVPAERAGVASAVISAAREMSGVLGIAVVGLALTAVESAQRRAGVPARAAFLDGYRCGLAIAAPAVLAGALMAWLALRDQSPCHDRSPGTRSPGTRSPGTRSPGTRSSGGRGQVRAGLGAEDLVSPVLGVEEVRCRADRRMLAEKRSSGRRSGRGADAFAGQGRDHQGRGGGR
jgi:EmrB/QacA subfamily drug resistance transporter